MQPQPQHPSSGTSNMIMPILLLGVVCFSVAFPAFLLSLVIWLCIRRSRSWQIGAIVAALLGTALLYQSHAALGLAFSTWEDAISRVIGDSGAWAELRASVFVLWALTLPIAPLLALMLVVVRPTPQVMKMPALAPSKAGQQLVPDQVRGIGVLGRASDGDLMMAGAGGYAVYPKDLLELHAVVIGASGSGKTEGLLRFAYLAAKVYGYRVIFLDAKGERKTAARFAAVMDQAGAKRVALFPLEAYNGWRGDGTALINRLMQIEDYTEPFYQKLAKDYLQLVCSAPGGPPRSSVQLLERLWIPKLKQLYEGDRRQPDTEDFDKGQVQGIRKRYRGFFNALNGKLDGAWAFEDVDAAYLLLDGLALKEETNSLARYFVEDFAHFVVHRRKNDPRPVLLIGDEFSAVSGSTDIANLYERVRSYNVAVITASQSYEGLGRDVERILDAASGGIFLFRTDKPDNVIDRAGTRHSMARSFQMRQPDPLSQSRPTGSATLHEREIPNIDPNWVRKLPKGQCFLIAQGAYRRIQIAMVQADKGAVDALLGLFERAAMAEVEPPRQVEQEPPPLLAPVTGKTVPLPATNGKEAKESAKEQREPNEGQQTEEPEEKSPGPHEKDRPVTF